MFKIGKGFSKIRLNEQFHFDDRGQSTRGHSLKLVKANTLLVASKRLIRYLVKVR